MNNKIKLHILHYYVIRPVLSAENETESWWYPDTKQYTAEKKLTGAHAQIKGTPRAKQQQQLYADTADAALPSG